MGIFGNKLRFGLLNKFRLWSHPSKRYLEILGVLLQEYPILLLGETILLNSFLGALVAEESLATHKINLDTLFFTRATKYILYIIYSILVTSIYICSIYGECFQELTLTTFISSFSIFFVSKNIPVKLN
jgi:hypothetical protein